MTKVALLGLGRMGTAMAGRIQNAGFELIVWTRDAEKAGRVGSQLGARVATTPAEAARMADVVLSSLADDAALEAVYLGPDGAVGGLDPATVAVDTSTVDPDTVRRVGGAVEAMGASFLDAPVSGSVSSVEQGILTIMVGGDPTVLDKVRPVLDSMAGKVIHAGELGAGSATKLAVNALVHGLNIALSEALVLAERAGVDRRIAYDVFAGGAGGAPFVHYKRGAYEDPDGTPVAFSLDLVAKDLDLITGLGRRVGASMRQAEMGLEIVQDAIEAGMGDRDLSAVAEYLRQQAQASTSAPRVSDDY